MDLIKELEEMSKMGSFQEMADYICPRLNEDERIIINIKTNKKKQRLLNVKYFTKPTSYNRNPSQTLTYVINSVN